MTPLRGAFVVCGALAAIAALAASPVSLAAQEAKPTFRASVSLVPTSTTPCSTNTICRAGA